MKTVSYANTRWEIATETNYRQTDQGVRMDGDARKEQPHRFKWASSSLRLKKKDREGDGARSGLGARGERGFCSVRSDPRNTEKKDRLLEDNGRALGAAARGIRMFSAGGGMEHAKGESDKPSGEARIEGKAKGKGPSGSTPEHSGTQASEGEEERGERGSNRLSKFFSSFSSKLSREKGSKEQPVLEVASESKPAEMEQRETRYSSGQFFFEYLVVVTVKKKGESYEPQITYQFPKRDGMVRFQKEEEEKTLTAITLFCFPEGINWAPLTEYRSETFSFVLTEIDGSRRNGYCRRLLPHGKGARPPEAYCIISKLACFGLFSKIFDEVEKRRQIASAMIYPFMQSLRESPFPAPGHTVKVKSFIPDSGTEIIELTRPLDPLLEHVDFRTLFKRLKDEEVLQVFASTVLERRIIFVADELSTLSQCIHAVAALLTPFIWQHTFISIVPKILIDVVMAPTPYLLGVQKQLLEEVMDNSDVLIVDLSEGSNTTFIQKLGDEKSILPPKLQTEILQVLSARKENSTPEELNKIVSAAFVPFFVKTVGHFSSHVKRNGKGGQGEFQKKSFYKAVESKTTRKFVKKFIQTQMFDLFIQEIEQQPAGQEGFFQKKIAEYKEKMKKEKKKH
ncbi:DENN domain-containing protein 2D-like isoform X1 [Acipenser oxyrinchus oxyrinchus]|uniref:DENN domain-containing protein 2D-like isoform X1 n=1 Tax=Acipenser oxyrinchus oxyrinchus TaxID=40147 RepID=A0AAD8CJT9_ACIOX|nr:DENN domain-containing protein 2D-like isoform X1 [Acipenser oxyrinchus oxyrinchus]